MSKIRVIIDIEVNEEKIKECNGNPEELLNTIKLEQDAADKGYFLSCEWNNTNGVTKSTDSIHNASIVFKKWLQPEEDFQKHLLSALSKEGFNDVQFIKIEDDVMHFEGLENSKPRKFYAKPLVSSSHKELYIREYEITVKTTSGMMMDVFVLSIPV